MLDVNYVYTIIIGMAVATYATRQVPFLVLGNKKLNENIVLWLSFIPVSVMSALLMPEIFTKIIDDKVYLYLSIDNLYLWTSIATFIVASIFKNFFVTVSFGMGFLAFLRIFFE